MVSGNAKPDRSLRQRRVANYIGPRRNLVAGCSDSGTNGGLMLRGCLTVDDGEIELAEDENKYKDERPPATFTIVDTGTFI